MTLLANTPTRMGEIPQGPVPQWRDTEAHWLWKEGEPFSPGIRSLLGPDLGRPRASCRSLWELIRASVLLCLQGLASFLSSTPLALPIFLQDFLSPKERDLMETSLSGLRISRSLTLYTLPTCGFLCVCFHQQQERTFPTMAEKDTDRLTDQEYLSLYRWGLRTSAQCCQIEFPLVATVK